jgi:glutamine synthetase
LVLADLLDHHTHQEVPHSPRAVLKKQVARARAMGFDAMMATELEFYLFENSYEDLRDGGLKALHPVSAYNEDYHIFQTTKEEDVMRAVRNGLYGAGIPIENTKGEADAGQEEVNYRYSDALDTADNHVLVKNGVKEIAWTKGKSVTFMAKYDTKKAGSSSHIHQSLWSLDGAASFHDEADHHGMSDLMKHYMAGQLHHARDITAFLAPYVNSYKRFTIGLFAPTKAVWSADNRTAGFRVCGEHTKAVRVECRIPGSDVNPYMACAALLAAGLDGIEQKMVLEPEMRGDMYQTAGIREIPRTLRDAASLMHGSAMLRAAFGDDVVEHYHHACQWEISETDRVVTDFELQRGFERS